MQLVKKLCLVLAAMAISGIANPGQGDDKKANESPKASEATITIKMSEGKPCKFRDCAVNFPKEYGVPLDYLTSLRQHISDARRKCDPVELMLLSQRVALAEKVAGKKASLTADEIADEAVMLAKLRGDTTELTAILYLSKETAKNGIEKELAAAKSRDKEAVAQASSGERPRAIHRGVFVRNNSTECVHIEVDGRNIGVVHTKQNKLLQIHTHRTPNVIRAICEEGHEVTREVNWGSVQVYPLTIQ